MPLLPTARPRYLDPHGKEAEVDELKKRR